MDKKYEEDVYGISVEKGGVGKSTMSQSMAYEFAKQGKKVLLIDADPQATLTGAFFKYSNGTFSGENISNIKNLFYDKEVRPLTERTTKYIENPKKGQMHEPHYLEEDMTIDFIPSNRDLLKMVESDEFKRQEKIDKIVAFIEKVKVNYDKVIIDAPPSLGIISTAILMTCKSIIVPIATKNVDTDGMIGFFNELDQIFYEQDVKYLTKIIILPTLYDSRYKDSKATLNSIKTYPNHLQATDNLRNIPCEVAEVLKYRSVIQDAPSFKMFLVPYIMDWSRSQNGDLLIQLEELAKKLEKR